MRRRAPMGDAMALDDEPEANEDVRRSNQEEHVRRLLGQSDVVVDESNGYLNSSNGDESLVVEEAPRRREHWSLPRMVLLCSGTAASAISWAAQIGYTTPEFKKLGISDAGAALIWLVGPFSGIVVQPVVGVLSDNCRSPWGRRKPFIAAGALVCVVSMILFSCAELMVPGVNILFGIASFTLLDCSLNAVMAAMRALIAEVLPLEQHSVGNAVLSIMAGVGKTLGYFLGSANLVKVFPFFRSQIRALYTIVAMLVLLFATSTLCVAKEQPTRAAPLRERSQSLSVVFADIWGRLRNLPTPIARVFLVQFFNMFGLFALMIYTTEWFAQNVFHAKTEENIEEAVRYGNRALLCMSFSSMFWSAIMPKAIDRFGLKVVYFLSETAMAVCLFSMMFIQSKQVALALFVVIGLPFASTNLIPWIVVTTASGRTGSAGLYSAVFNLAQCIPDVILSLIASILLTVFSNDISSVFAFGGVGAVIAMIGTFYVIVPTQNEETAATKPNAKSYASTLRGPARAEEQLELGEYDSL